MAVLQPGLGAGRVLLGADRHPAVGSGVAVKPPANTAQGRRRPSASSPSRSCRRRAAGLLRSVLLSRLLLGLAVDELGAASRLRRLFQPGPRRLLRRRHVHDGRRSPPSADVPFLATVPIAAAMAALLGVGIGAVVFRMKPAARRAVRAADARRHLRGRHHHPQHADRWRRRRVHERRAAAAPHADADRHDLRAGLR